MSLGILLAANLHAVGTNNQELDDLIKSENAIVNQHLPKLQQFISDAKQAAITSQSKAQLMINNSKANANKDFNLDWLNDLTLPKPQMGSLLTELYIFVSLSMPKSRLIQLIIDANHYQAIVVLRGLKNNSYQETANFLQPVIQQAGCGLTIDPNLFKEYNITQVPVFVLYDSVTKKYDKFTGNISLKYALQEFAKNGDLQAEARNILGLAK